MTLDLAKQAKLNALLATLPQSQAAKLLAACEEGVAGLPLDMVREALAARAELAIERVFGAAAPLVTQEGGPKRPGQIARSSLDALAVLAEEVAPKAFAALRAGAPPVNAHREILGRALRGVLRHDDGAESRYRRRLGGERGYEDACDVSALLCAEPELSDGLARLPERIEEFDAPLVRQVHDLHDLVLAKDRAAPLLFMFLILERLEKPAQILRLLKRLAGQSDDVLASQTDVGALGDGLLDEAEAAIGQMDIPPHVAPDGAQIVDALVRFAAISKGMTRELGIRRDGKWGLRLTGLRNQCARNMDAVCAAAPKAIDQALPRTRLRLAGATAMRPDVSAPPQEVLYARGLNYAIILGGAGEHAATCAFTAEYGKAREAAERVVDVYCDGVIDLLQFADEAMLPQIEPWRQLAERFVAALFDDRATEVFRRRAAAAAAARMRAKVA